MTGLRVTKTFNEIKFEGDWGELEAKNCPHGGNLRADKIKNSGAQFFLCAFLRYLVPCLHHTKIRAPRDPFSRNLEPNRGPEMSLSCLKSISIYNSLGNYKLSICSYL